MQQNATSHLDPELQDDITDRLEHIVLDVIVLRAWAGREHYDLAESIIERLDVVQAQLGVI